MILMFQNSREIHIKNVMPYNQTKITPKQFGIFSVLKREIKNLKPIKPLRSRGIF